MCAKYIRIFKLHRDHPSTTISLLFLSCIRIKLTFALFVSFCWHLNDDLFANASLVFIVLLLIPSIFEHDREKAYLLCACLSFKIDIVRLHCRFSSVLIFYPMFVLLILRHQICAFSIRSLRMLSVQLEICYKKCITLMENLSFSRIKDENKSHIHFNNITINEKLM